MNEVDEQTKTYILEKYIRRALMGVRHRGNGREIKVNCPFCGDKELKGTVWLTNTYRWCYSCWRASCRCSSKPILATKWLKEVNPGLLDEYKKEITAQSGKTEKEKDTLKIMIERQREIDSIEQKRQLEEEMKADRESTKYFKRISVPGIYQIPAINFCKRRLIPESVWSKFYYCDEDKYHGRVIIPFYDRSGKIEFFQGRTLIKSKAKYLSRVGHTALYNWDFIDKTKPIAILEGPINSIFVENSTATVGACSSGELDEKLKDLDCWYIFDNDKAGRKEAWKRVQDGKPVFMWNQFLFAYNLPSGINDINDVIMYMKRNKPFTLNELKPYFTRYVEQYKTLELDKLKEEFPTRNTATQSDIPEPEEDVD